MLPLTRHTSLSMSAMLLTVVATALTAWRSPLPYWQPWLVCGLSAVYAELVQSLLSRYHLGRPLGRLTFTVAWPTLTATSLLAMLYLPPTGSPWQPLAAQGLLLTDLLLLLATWQEKLAPLPMLAIGLTIGVAASWLPGALWWMVGMPLLAYVVRSASLRNVCSILTGVVLGLWGAYCMAYAIRGEAAADAIVAALPQAWAMHPLRFDIAGWEAWTLVAAMGGVALMAMLATLLMPSDNDLITRSAIVLTNLIVLTVAIATVLTPERLGLHLGLLAVGIVLMQAQRLATDHMPLDEWTILTTLSLWPLALVASMITTFF